MCFYDFGRTDIEKEANVKADTADIQSLAEDKEQVSDGLLAAGCRGVQKLLPLHVSTTKSKHR